VTQARVAIGLSRPVSRGVLDTDEEEYSMGKIYDSITDDLARWLGAQTLFFVATATTDPDTRVNVSPRGLGTFRVLESNGVA
jgi:hypothetical protein